MQRSPNTHFGALIERGLRSSARTVRQLAEECGVAHSYITKLKQGKVRRPSGELLSRIARVLGQDVDEYRLALLADHGELPRWGKVLSNEIGVGLTRADEEAIAQFVEALRKSRRGH